MGRAERGAQTALLLLALQEIDHAIAAPHVLLERFAVVDAGDSKQVEAVALAKTFTRRLELRFELADLPVSIGGHIGAVRGDDDVPVRPPERLRDQIFCGPVIRPGVNDVHAEVEARE